MDVYEISDLVNTRGMTYKDGWRFRAYPAYSRQADHREVVRVNWEADVDNSSPAYVDPRPRVLASGTFEVTPGDRTSVEDQILAGVIEAEMHETREFLRFGGFAPYHPHRADGDRRWATRRQ